MADHVDPYRVYLPQLSYPPGSGSGQGVEDTAESAESPLRPYYTPEELGQVNDELRRLFKPQNASLRLGRTHFAPSPTWRDELSVSERRVFSPPSRFVVRVHVFAEGYQDHAEKNGPAPHAGRYLGFVSLRPSGYPELGENDGAARRHAFLFVIDAELATPPQMMRPRYHVLSTTASAARLGILPFRSALYTAPARDSDRGAVCVHHAVSQALHLIMGRFGCRPISQIEFEWHLWKHQNPRGSGQTGALSFHPGPGKGANLYQALQVVRDSCNGGGFIPPLRPWDDPDSGRLSVRERHGVQRLVTDALACGLPIIALVQSQCLLTGDVRDGNKFSPHAVLVLGMHLLNEHEESRNGGSPRSSDRVDEAELPGRLIIHDTLHRGPFYECLFSDFLDAAEKAYWNPDREMSADEKGVHLLVLGPRGLSLSHAGVLHYAGHSLEGSLVSLEDPGPDLVAHALAAYLRAGKVELPAAASPDRWRFICRFLSAGEVLAKFGPDADGGEILEIHQGRETEDHWRDLAPGFYWTVEIRHPLVSDSDRPSDLPEAARQRPALVFVWSALAPDLKEGGKAAEAAETEAARQPALLLRYPLPRPGNI